MSAHALLSPSSAERWMHCEGSVAFSQGMPDTSSEYADEGTAAHTLAAMCFNENLPAMAFFGRIIEVNERGFAVDDEMGDAVQEYVDTVHTMAGEDAIILTEQRLPIDIGVPDQFGTSDNVVISGTELQVHDLKYGKGVRVYAEENKQMMMYALGALPLAEMLGFGIDKVRLVIHQPRLNHVSEWVTTVDALREFQARATVKAQRVIRLVQERPADLTEHLNPSEEACRWCKGKATCPKLRDLSLSTVGGPVATPEDFVPQVPDELTEDDLLALCMKHSDLIESWIKAVRAEVERRLCAGIPVKGYKLVLGRKGNRAWTDSKEAEDSLKTMRVRQDQMYDFKLISPTTAEKLAKDKVLGDKQWAKLQTLIHQPEGKPSVAPSSDKRPGIQLMATADDFEAVV